jgi:hypothetical protein
MFGAFLLAFFYKKEKTTVVYKKVVSRHFFRLIVSFPSWIHSPSLFCGIGFPIAHRIIGGTNTSETPIGTCNKKVPKRRWHHQHPLSSPQKQSLRPNLISSGPKEDICTQ